MEIYLWIYGIALLIFFIRNKKVSNTISFLFLALLTIVCVFRGNYIGSDTSTYLLLYETDKASERYSNEFLFYLITKFARNRGIDKYGCQVIMGLCFYVPFFLFVFKKSRWPAISLFVFIVGTNRYFWETFNTTRQMAAVPMVLWAISYYYQKKYLVGSFFLFLGCGFHMSALFSAPIIILCCFLNFSKGFLGGIFIGSIIWAFVFSSADSVSGLLSNMTFLDVVGLGKYIYLEGYRPEMERTFWGLIVLLIPHNFLAMLLFFKARNNYISKVYLCGVLFLNLVAVFPISYRFVLCITSLDVIIIPALMSEKSHEIKFYKAEESFKSRSFPQKNVAIAFFTLILFLYSLWSFTSKKEIQEEYVPYETFL